MKHKAIGILTIFLVMGALSTVTVSASIIKGEWGCYEHPAITGQIKGTLSGGYLLAKFTYNNHVAYLSASVVGGRLIGIALYNWNHYPVIGKYLAQNGNVIAGISVAGFTGWVVAKIM